MHTACVGQLHATAIDLCLLFAKLLLKLRYFLIKFMTFKVCVLLFASAFGVSVHADTHTVLDNAALLGQSAAQLQPQLAGLQTVHSPRRLSSGALGSARLPDALCEGMHFEQTFFFVNQKLRQMELLLLSAPADITTLSQASLLQTLRTELGPELASFNAAPLPDSASWVSGDADVTLYRSGRPERPSLRIVIRQREIVSADEL